MSDLSRLADEIEAATLDLASHLAWLRFRRIVDRELRYQPDQPRAPGGTPQGGQWIDDNVHVAAVRTGPRCDGVAGSCQNGGSFGVSGMIRIGPKKLCWDCAIKQLGLQGLPIADQLRFIGYFDRDFRQ